MLQIPVSEVIDKIKKETNLSDEEINSKIQEKIHNLEGLVSEEGAAYIVASELGVSLLNSVTKNHFKVENISEGMRSVDIDGKVIRVFQPRHWEKGKKKGTVASFVLADKTGTIRVVVWDDRVKLIADEKLKEGTIVRIKNAFAKKNNRGEREIHLSMNSQLILNPEGVEIEVQNIEKKQREFKEVKIKDIEEGTNVKILATVTQIFDPYFYLVCPQCGKKLADNGECEEHGKVEPTNSVVFNFILDDGTDTLRCVAFKETAKILMGVQEDFDTLANEDPEGLKEKLNKFLLGRVIEVEGVIRRNQAFDRLEMIINRSKVNINVKELAKSLYQK